MANIELHGFPIGGTENITDDIRARMIGSRVPNDYVISIVLSDVQDFQRVEQPFFRLYTTKDYPEAELINILLDMGYDVEHIPHIHFYPKRIK